MQTRLGVFAFVGVVACAGCAGDPGPVKLETTWPESPGGYSSAYQRWTRQATARRSLNLTLDVTATLKSAEWRAAWVAANASRLSLTDDERSKLAATEQAEAKAVWEVELVVATQSLTWQDFGAPTSMWRLALVGDDGREVMPLSVKPEVRQRAELQAWFPALDGLRRAYVVKFPVATADGRPLVAEGGERLTLEVTGAQGSVKLVWRGR